MNAPRKNPHWQKIHLELFQYKYVKGSTPMRKIISMTWMGKPKIRIRGKYI